MNKSGKIGVGLIITLVVFLCLAFGAFTLYGFINTLRNQSVGYENQLNAQYLANQAYLSEFVGGFYEQVGVANLKSDKMDKILTDAVKGRYDKQGFSSKGAFFSAVVEAYPAIDLSIYDKIVVYIQAKREGYRANQEKLLDMLRSFDTWRQKDLISSFIVQNILGVPSDRLEARIGDQVTKGLAAREQMYKIVLVESVGDMYKTGKMKALSASDVK
jgi:hypothetical protein